MAWSGLTEKQSAARRKYHKEYRKRRNIEDPEYLEKRRASARRSAKNRRIKIKSFLTEARDVPCDSCAIKLPPETIDFDHIFGKKHFDIAHWNRNTYRSINDIAKEVKKCRVVCSNCHRLRHFEERQAAARGTLYWTDYKISEENPHAVNTDKILSRMADYIHTPAMAYEEFTSFNKKKRVRPTLDLGRESLRDKVKSA